MTIAKQKTVDPQVAEDPDEPAVSTLEALGIQPQEVVVGTEAVPTQAPVRVPTVNIRVNRDIENMSHVGYFGAEHYTFEQGHEYSNVPIYIALELERIGAVWH